MRKRKHLRYDSIREKWVIDYGGRIHRKRRFFDSRSLAEEFMTTEEFLVAAGYCVPTVVPSMVITDGNDVATVPVEKAVNWYCQNVAVTKSPFSQKWEPKKLLDWMERYRGRPLESIGLKELFECRSRLLLHNLEPQTVNRRITLLKSFFKACHQARFIKVNPAVELKKLAVPEAPHAEVISEMEQARLLKAAKPWVRNPLWFAMKTGARRGEIVNLRWGAVNLKERTLIIESNKGFHTKSKRSRKLPLTETMAALLIDILQEAKLQGRGGSNDFVFVTSTGIRIIADRLTREAKKVMRRVLKRDEGAVHIWRHSALTLMLQKGADIETVRRVAGQSSLTVTQRYVHSNDVAMLRAMDQLKPEYQIGKNVALGGTGR